jgi:hypothetical protein
VNSAAFECVARRLAEGTGLDTLAARGTVRIVLREAGLDAATVAPAQMRTVVERLLPAALRARGVAEADALCARICSDLVGVRDPGAVRETPERVFARLGS